LIRNKKNIIIYVNVTTYSNNENDN